MASALQPFVEKFLDCCSPILPGIEFSAYPPNETTNDTWYLEIRPLIATIEGGANDGGKIIGSFNLDILTAQKLFDKLEYTQWEPVSQSRNGWCIAFIGVWNKLKIVVDVYNIPSKRKKRKKLILKNGELFTKQIKKPR